ncbi:FecR domain-containing protein [Zunongwangia sp. F363]|uniref:FecR domain-containing protein n=1 Tax=Autumnicola tepida TaxID=3075595 RepID=A0ABU3CDU7_9FLAO|nr:FecR domain-containing protein [Zunongwangia sp. F363]MDT0644528.1 FecR domain-containing protein [Zunongwangia sp. F363]
MKQEEFIALFEKYAENCCSRKEKKAVESILGQFQEKNRNLFPDLSRERKKRLISTIEVSIQTKKTKSLIPIKKFALAAVLAVIIGLGLWVSLLTPSKSITHYSGNAEKKEVQLQDGSKVTLNSNSRITYFKTFREKREVILEGEAFFKVARNPDKPFTITTGTVKTTVLGTSFNINAYEHNLVKVSVNTGKVKVESDKSSEMAMLSKDQRVLFKDGYPEAIHKGISEDLSAWTKNIILLDNTSLAETAKILKNWYGIKIDIDEKTLENLTISGKFQNENPQDILRSIALVKKLKIDTINQNQILIRRKTKILN